MRLTQRSRELLHRGAVDVFNASAVFADRVMMMSLGSAEHVRGFALCVGPRGDVTSSAKPVERSIDGGERNALARPFERAMNLGR